MKLIVLFCVISYVCAEFEEFKKKHKKNYKSAADEAVAKEHYARHMQFYEQHNAKYKAGQVPFQVGPNKFADQNGTDLISKICRTVQSKISTALPFMRDATQYPLRTSCCQLDFNNAVDYRSRMLRQLLGFCHGCAARVSVHTQDLAILSAFATISCRLQHGFTNRMRW